MVLISGTAWNLYNEFNYVREMSIHKPPGKDFPIFPGLWEIAGELRREMMDEVDR